MSSSKAVCLSLLLLAAASCTSGNPSRTDSRWKPQESAKDEDASAGSKPAAASAGDAGAAQPGTQPTSADPGAAAATSFGLAEAGAVPVVARVAEETIDVGELLDAWMQVNSRELRDIYERLISAKVVEIEARRTGITLTPEQIEQGYQTTVAELEAEFVAVNPGLKLDDWIIGELGMEPEHYRAGLRLDVERQLLAPLVVRSFTMAHERRTVRVLVTDTRPEIEDALAEVRAGGDFDELVAERSVDPNKENGGRIPAVLRGPSALSRLVFLTEVGDVGGPIQEPSEGRWMIVRVDSEEPVVQGPWSLIQERIEASLAAQPITDPEYWQWKAEMSRRHEVDTEPLLELMRSSTKP